MCEQNYLTNANNQNNTVQFLWTCHEIEITYVLQPTSWRGRVEGGNQERKCWTVWNSGMEDHLHQELFAAWLISAMLTSHLCTLLHPLKYCQLYRTVKLSRWYWLTCSSRKFALSYSGVNCFVECEIGKGGCHQYTKDILSLLKSCKYSLHIEGFYVQDLLNSIIKQISRLEKTLCRRVVLV